MSEGGRMKGGNSDLARLDVNKIKDGREEKPPHSSEKRVNFSRDEVVVKDDEQKNKFVENPQQYKPGSQSETGGDDTTQEIWEDLLISLLGLKSDYNHLLPSEDGSKSDLLTMLRPATQIQEESTSPHVHDSFHSNPIASPTQDVVLTVLNDDGTQNKITRDFFTRATSKWGFLITNLVLETFTAACDQLSSPRRPLFALLGLLTSLSALLICICELLCKGQREMVSWRRAGRLYYPFPHKLIFSSFAETFGFICAVFQCIFSTVGYIYFEQHENNPIKLNVFPIAFAACLACSMACREKDKETDHAD